MFTELKFGRCGIFAGQRLQKVIIEIHIANKASSIFVITNNIIYFQKRETKNYRHTKAGADDSVDSTRMENGIRGKRTNFNILYKRMFLVSDAFRFRKRNSDVDIFWLIKFKNGQTKLGNDVRPDKNHVTAIVNERGFHDGKSD